VEVTAGRVSVTLRVPQSLDVPGAVAEVARRLRSGGAGFRGSVTTETRSTGPAGRVRRLRGSSSSLGEVSVDVVEPSDRAEPATFKFSAPAGGDMGEGLALIAAALAAAASPRGRGARSAADDLDGLFGGGGGGGGGGLPLGPSLSGATIGLILGALDPFLGHLHEVLAELERGQRGAGLGGATQRRTARI
jgi:hypothetical protein